MKKKRISVLILCLMMMVVGIQATTVESEIPLNVGKNLMPMQQVEILTGYRYSAAAIDENGDLWVWGSVKDGLLPIGTKHQYFRYDTTRKNNPYIARPLKVDTNVRQIVVEDVMRTGAFMVKEDNTLWAWGLSCYTTNLETVAITPVKIMEDVQAVEATDGDVYVLKTDNTLWHFNYNTLYGTGENFTSLLGEPVQIDSDVKAVTAAHRKAFIIKEDNTLWGWGGCHYGEIFSMDEGIPTVQDYKDVEKTKVMEDVAQVAIGRYHTAVLKTDGSVWTWGANQHGQLGQGEKLDITTIAAPAQILGDVQKIAVSENHGVALKVDGSLWSWGSNYHGEVGNGEMTERVYEMQNYKIITDKAVLTPIRIRDRIIDISAGSMSTLALTEEGILLEWGNRKMDWTDKYNLSPTQLIVISRR